MKQFHHNAWQYPKCSFRKHYLNDLTPNRPDFFLSLKTNPQRNMYRVKVSYLEFDLVNSWYNSDLGSAKNFSSLKCFEICFRLSYYMYEIYFQIYNLSQKCLNLGENEMTTKFLKGA